MMKTKSGHVSAFKYIYLIFKGVNKMKLKTITNENARKIKGKIAQAVICAETLILTAQPIFATDMPDELSGAMNKLLKMVSNICVGVGIIIALWGIVSFATSMSAQNAEQRKHDIIELIAGLIIAIAPKILVYLGLQTEI